MLSPIFLFGDGIVGLLECHVNAFKFWKKRGPSGITFPIRIENSLAFLVCLHFLNYDKIKFWRKHWNFVSEKTHNETVTNWTYFVYYQPPEFDSSGESLSLLQPLQNDLNRTHAQVLEPQSDAHVVNNRKNILETVGGWIWGWSCNPYCELFYYPMLRIHSSQNYVNNVSKTENGNCFETLAVR